MVKGIIIIFALMVWGHFQASANGGRLDVMGYYLDLITDRIHLHQGAYTGMHFLPKGRVLALDSNEVEPIKLKSAEKLPHPIQLSGKAHVSDGDTIRIGKTKIRLFGIDAPEIKQTCAVNGKVWDCGLKARQALVKAIGNWQVSCEQKDRDRYRRVVATCIAGGASLNSLMVRDGWALAYRRYSTDYEQDELVARDEKLGIWQGTFIAPWDWRRSRRSNHKY